MKAKAQIPGFSLLGRHRDTELFVDIGFKYSSGNA